MKQSRAYIQASSPLRLLYTALVGDCRAAARLLFITEEDEVFRRAGLVVTYDEFAPLPELKTVYTKPRSFVIGKKGERIKSAKAQVAALRIVPVEKLQRTDVSLPSGRRPT